jgi:small subunit ribosomal protein S3
MGRKVHPIGMRLGINQGWQGRWFAEGSQYRNQLHQDFSIRSLLLGITSKGGAAKSADVRELRKELPDTVRNGKAGISRIEVERFPGKIRVAIYTAKPGILIGRKGEGVKKVRSSLETLVGKKVDLDIKEVASPDTDAMLVAKNVADQLERRIAYRRAMKRAIQQAIKQGAQGIKIMVGSRLGGAEMSRDVWLREGRVPLQTLRANVDFAITEASTTYGQIGVKVWIYKGEAVPEVEEKAEATEGVYVSE